MLVGLCLFFNTNLIYSQDNAEDIINAFFDTYQKNTDKALDDIYATNVWGSEMKDALTGMKKTVRGYSDEMGKYYGFEFITKQKCTERFLLFAYMLRYDRQPMQVLFAFYKPNDKWILYSLNFNSHFDEDLETAAQYYIIQNPDNK